MLNREIFGIGSDVDFDQRWLCTMTPQEYAWLPEHDDEVRAWLDTDAGDPEDAHELLNVLIDLWALPDFYRYAGYDTIENGRVLAYLYRRGNKDTVCADSAIYGVLLRSDVRIVSRTDDAVVLEWDWAKGYPFFRGAQEAGV